MSLSIYRNVFRKAIRLSCNNIRYFSDIVPKSNNLPDDSKKKSNHLKKAVESNKITHKPGSNIKFLASGSSDGYKRWINFGVNHTLIKQQNDKNVLYLNLEITGRGGDIVRPSTFLFCIDKSGSMNDTLGDKHDMEMSAFTRGDMLKHTMRVAISSMRPEDKVGIVAFNDTSNVLLPLTNMDADGKKQTMNMFNNMSFDSGTNLWDGLKNSMNIMSDLTHNHMINRNIILLTDGEPNINPIRGIVSEFTDQFNKTKFNIPIHTMGYSYSLDSQLLTDISHESGGQFAHIPDYTMCNTVVINRLANTFASIVNNVCIGNIRTSSSNTKINIVKPYITNEKDVVFIGSMQSEQSKHILLRIADYDMNHETVTIDIDLDGETIRHEITIDTDKAGIVKDCMTDIKNTNDITQGYRLYRSALTNVLDTYARSGSRDAIIHLNDSMKAFNHLNKMLESSKTKSNDTKLQDQIKNLMTNIESPNVNDGQFMKAFTNSEWMNRWGHHYIRSWVSAENLNISPNFKDKGLIHYGSDLFRSVKQEIEDIFATIPAPTPSTGQTYTKNYTQTTYNPTGPCVDGNGIVVLENGTTKRVKELIKGDILSSGAKIECVIRTTVGSGKCDMVRVNGLTVTPFHPIRFVNNLDRNAEEGEWMFPCRIPKKHPSYSNVREYECDYIYNFVLDKYHIINVNGLDIITMGHSYTNGILKHPFFGSQKIIEVLKRFSGYSDGLVCIEKYKPKYDTEGLICDF